MISVRRDRVGGVGVDRFSLVVHDWGTVGLALAQRHPERVHRLVILDAVPRLLGYRWHRLARIWRTPRLGELAMLLTGKPTLRLFSREAAAAPGPLPAHWVDRIWSHFDAGTKRAILRLYRNSPPAVLAGAGARLGSIPAPALVVWGDRDPYLPARFADAFGAALPNATVEHEADASHWCWIDRPDLVDRVARFLAGP